MARLHKYTTEVLFSTIGAASRTSLLVTTLTNDPNTIKVEAVRKAKSCYGLDIFNLVLGGQSSS